MADLNNPSDTEGQLIAASKVNGTAVYNRAGEKLGSIYDLMTPLILKLAHYSWRAGFDSPGRHLLFMTCRVTTAGKPCELRRWARTGG
jgi:hypothetical protein